jgi:hypothetical protein
VKGTSLVEYVGIMKALGSFGPLTLSELGSLAVVKKGLLKQSLTFLAGLGAIEKKLWASDIEVYVLTASGRNMLSYFGVEIRNKPLLRSSK